MKYHQKQQLQQQDLYPSLCVKFTFELSHSPGVAKATEQLQLNLMKLKLIKLKQLS
jgi:hypothetical protein